MRLEIPLFDPSKASFQFCCPGSFAVGVEVVRFQAKEKPLCQSRTVIWRHFLSAGEKVVNLTHHFTANFG
jgi:hypothetical protein